MHCQAGCCIYVVEMKFILACVLFFCAFELKIGKLNALYNVIKDIERVSICTCASVLAKVQCDQAVEVYSISTPVQASKSVSLCINTAVSRYFMTPAH